MSLLFAPDHRPDAAAMLALQETGETFSVAGTPADGDEQLSAEGCCVELLANGLAFELFGLRPGEATAPASCEFLIDLEGDAAEWNARGLEAITLVPGAHLRGGQAILPVVRTMCWLAAQLSEFPGVQALAWHGAGSWISPSYFRSCTMHWREGGPFPALGLTAIKPTPDGGIQTVGMAFFTGQEIRLEPELAEQPKSATRLAVRLVNRLVEEDPLGSDVQIELAGGDRYLLRPARHGNLIRVWAV